MIKTIIKRDGRKEDFNPEKINNWGEWASKTLGRYVDWPSVVLEAVSTLPEECEARKLQERLIKVCLTKDTWSYNRMAGRLYASFLYKEIYNNNIPTVKELHDKLYELGLMVKLDYSDEEYEEVEKLIDHKLDLKSAYFELDHIRKKYAIQNRKTKTEYETQQFVYMRMAMALAENQPRERRMKDVAKFYEHLSNKRINAPTPNYVNLGTKLKGYASCCLYTVADDIKSLAIGDHIAYMMTAMSAGIGSHLNTRSIGDPVRNGAIQHLGKLGYYRAMQGAVKANMQNGRGGACTTHYNAYDPEVETIIQLKNPMSTEDKKIRGIDYSIGTNKFFARKVAKKEKVFLFNSFTAPDLYDALYSGNQELFEQLYEKYENDPTFEKKYVNAREILILSETEAYETGRYYKHWIDEINRHTPFKETIYSSNLCQEIALATKPYMDMRDLYSEEDHGRGEVAMCSLGGIVVSNITSEEQYREVAYYTLLMIDKCIHMSEYVLPHIGVTAKSRLSAGVGIIGLAHYLAKNKLKYSSPEGKQAINELCERHYWHLVNASLQLAKELGPAPWMHKTKWVDGWLPIDTYNRNVDDIVSSDLHYDWEGLRKEIIKTGGIRNTVLVAHMPSEASSKSSGTTNGLYPIRDFTLIKTDNNVATYWAAPEGEKLANYYEIAWDISTKDLTDVYAICQKWTDQAISADFYRKLVGDDTITSTEMVKDYLYKTKMGLKTQYYTNSLTASGVNLEGDEPGCAGGSCTL